MPSFLKKLARRRRRTAEPTGPNHKHPALSLEVDTNNTHPFVPGSIDIDPFASLVSPLKSPTIMHKSSSCPSLAMTAEGSSFAFSSTNHSFSSSDNNSTKSSETEDTAVVNNNSGFAVKDVTLPPRPEQSQWSEEDFHKVIRVWDLSPVEITKMRALEDQLSDITHWKNNPFEVVRFLKGPQGHKAAESLIRKMIDWRIQNNIDSIMEDYTPPAVLLDYYPSAILHGLDHDGDPIYLERAGATDASSLLKRFGHDGLIKHIVWLRELCGRGEWIQEHEARMGRPITQVTIVYDLAGLNARHMKSGVLPFFAAMMQLTQDYYTGPVKRMVIIRAPSVFRYVWPIVKHVFPPSAHEKMTFSGPRDHEQVLSRFMDLSVLPPAISPHHGCGFAAEGMPQRFEGGIIPAHNYDSPVRPKPTPIQTNTTTTTATKHATVNSPAATISTAGSSSRVSVSASVLASGSFLMNDREEDIALDPLS